MTMVLNTLDDPLAGIQPITLEDQWIAARRWAAHVLEREGIQPPWHFDDIPPEVLDQIDNDLHAMGLVFCEPWPREKPKGRRRKP